MTASYYHGALQDVLAEVQGLAQNIADVGFEVTRINALLSLSENHAPS
jgi:hypothetical protein